MEGFIALHREIQSHPIWLSEPFSRGQAWVDLIALANHARGFIIENGQKIVIERGQCGRAKVKLAKRWKWSRGKVDRFISMLETEQMVSVKQYNGQDNGITIITICNYDKYQFKKNEDSTTDSTTDGQRIEQRTGSGQDTNNNEKNEKNGEARARVYTREATPPPPPENENENLRKEPPPPSPQKIPQWAIVSLQKRQEKGEKLSESEQQIMANYLKSIGIQEPKKPPEDPYAVAKSLIWQRDKLGRGHLFTASQISEIAKYESLHNNNHLNGARVG